MKPHSLALVCLLGFVCALALAQEVEVEDTIKEVREIHSDDEDSFDIASLLKELVEDHVLDIDEREKRDLDAVTKGSESDLARSGGELVTEDLDKYNGFADAIFSNLKKSIQENSDPMRLVLRRSGQVTKPGKRGPPKKAGGNKKRGNKRKGVRKGGNRRKAGNRKGGNRRNNRRKENQRKGNRRNGVRGKEVGGEEIEGREVDYDDEYEEEEETNERVKREITDDGLEEDYVEGEEEYEDEDFAGEEDIVGREGKSLDGEEDYLEEDYLDYEEEEEETGLESAREGKAIAATDEEARKAPSAPETTAEGRQRKNRRRKRRGKGCKSKKCTRRRRRQRQRRLRKQRLNRGKRSTSLPTMTLSGISNVRRVGDVTVRGFHGFQNVKANFEIGPITMRAERKVGNKIRRGEAETERIEGSMTIKVRDDGSARPLGIAMKKPKVVRISGTLGPANRKSTDNKLRSMVLKSKGVISRSLRNGVKKVLDFTSML